MKRSMPMREYLAYPAISRSFLVELVTRSPAHAKWKKEHPPKETEARRWGRAVHTRVLEPEVWSDLATTVPAGLNLARKDDKATYAAVLQVTPGKKGDMDAEFYRSNPDRVLLAEDEADTIESIAAAVRGHAGARKLMEAGEPEASYFWDDPTTGIECKARADWTNFLQHSAVDLKTCQDASPEAFQRDALKYHYHMQAWFYVNGINAALGEEAIKVFRIIAVEKTPPYGVGVYSMEQDQMELGGDQCSTALAKLKQCMETDEWPAYSNKIESLYLPKWKRNELASASLGL